MKRNVQTSVLFKTAVSTGKVMLTVLWDVKGMVHSEFMPSDTTIIYKEYCETMGKLKA
jgi:hypothetical protein